MDFNFTLKDTSVMRAVKTARFPLFSFAKIIRNFFFAFFVIALIFLVTSFFGFGSQYLAIKVAAFLLALLIIFWNISLFVDHKIKHSGSSADLLADAMNTAGYNLAGLLSFDAAQVVEKAIQFCSKKNIPVNATSLLYFLIKYNKETSLIAFRLGISIKKAETDAKNYLEKREKQIQGAAFFAEDFQNTMKEAVSISIERQGTCVDVKEMLVALAKHDPFFKTVLVEYDLKYDDVENITLWLDLSEKNEKEYGTFWSYENLVRQGSFGKSWAAGYTITLDKYAVDLTRLISKWTFHEIVGHTREIEEVAIILAKSHLSNVLIVGDPGTGRKSIIEAITQQCYLGKSLPELNFRKVVELDLVSLSAQIQNFEKLETILDQIFYEAANAGNVILVINELQNFVMQKMQKAGTVDISGIVSKYLAIPSFKFIATTTFDGLHKNIEQNSAFLDFFRKVEVKEVSEKETIRILQTLALGLERKHHMLILYPSVREIVSLTARYMPSLPFPKKALDILDEVVVYVQTKKEKIILPHHVSEIIALKTEIPVGKIESKEKETLLNLENLIHQRIVNQEEAVKEISIAMRRARAGIASKTRPMGTFLFMGPTGVGKTETAKALSHIYFGSEDKMIRLDMSEFQGVADIPRLLGAVSPVEMQGLLTTPVRENPFSLLLLDEIEKSHPNILNLFLQVFDEGHITDGQGRKVVFTNTIIICTSNAGADIIFKQAQANQAIDKQNLLTTLVDKGIFKPEFINRFDAAVIFHPLTKQNLLDIAQLSLMSLQKSLKEKEIDFEITEALKEKIVELSYKPEYGAREMRRVIQDVIENKVAEALLSDAIKKSDVFKVNPESFELIVNGK